MAEDLRNNPGYTFKDIVKDIYIDIQTVYYERIPIKTATQEAFLELDGCGLDFSDVKYILENGFDCARSRRKEEIVEKCIRKGKKVLKVVVEKMISSNGSEYWRIRHTGIFTFKKRRFGEKHE